MVISTLSLRIILFFIILFIVFIIERFRFPYIKACCKYVFKVKALGESIAMIIGAFIILGIIWINAIILSGIPASVIVVEKVKYGVVDYRIEKAIGDYKGVKVSLMDYYIDNQTSCWFILKPIHYGPKNARYVSFGIEHPSQKIKGDTIVKLDNTPNFIFTGASETIKRGILDSGPKWSLEIY